MNDSTRRYARSLAEAFPRDAESASTGDWEYAHEESHRVSDWIIAIACLIVVGLLTLGVFQ